IQQNLDKSIDILSYFDNEQQNKKQDDEIEPVIEKKHSDDVKKFGQSPENLKKLVQKIQKKKSKIKRALYPHETIRPLFAPSWTIFDKIKLFPYKKLTQVEKEENQQTVSIENLKKKILEKKSNKDQTIDINQYLSFLTCIFLSNYHSFLNYKPIFSLNMILELNIFLQSNILEREISIVISNLGGSITQWLKNYTDNVKQLKVLQKKKKRNVYKISELVPATLVLQNMARVHLSSTEFLTFLKTNYPLNGHAIYLNNPDILSDKIFWVERILSYLSVECEHLTNEFCFNHRREKVKNFSKTSTCNTCNCFKNCEKFASLYVLTYQEVPYKLSTLILIRKLYNLLVSKHGFESTSDHFEKQRRVISWMSLWLDECCDYLKKSNYFYVRLIFGFDKFDYEKALTEKRDDEIFKKENRPNVDDLQLFEEDNKQKKTRIIESSDEDEIIASSAFRSQ
ncbi:hypothetical protein M153_15030002741, partial [Pseudoloma neurophilia]